MRRFSMLEVISILGLPMPQSGRSSYNINCPYCDTNPNVQKAFADLSSLLGEIGNPFGTHLWNPEYKGLDDYMRAFLIRYK